MTEYAQKRIVGLEVKNAERGEVTAIVSTFDVVDRDGDVVLSGAIKDGSPVKLSSYAHKVITEGEAPVGKGVVRVVGNQAVFEGRYFMRTRRAQDAFETVKELGPDSEWSIGYFPRVRTAPMTKQWAALGAKRLIAGLDLLEVSPVFVASNPQTSTVGTKSPAPDEQRELAAIAKALVQRDLQMIDMQLRLNPPRADHMVPPLVKERLADVTDFACKWLGLDYLEVRYYEPRPSDNRVGFYHKSEPNVVWVAAGRRADEMALTLAHEAVHAAGYDTEAAAEQGAETIVKAWEGQQTTLTPYGFPLRTYDQEPTVGSCGMFPPTGGW